jgi:hypothetical protein
MPYLPGSSLLFLILFVIVCAAKKASHCEQSETISLRLTYQISDRFLFSLLIEEKFPHGVPVFAKPNISVTNRFETIEIAETKALARRSASPIFIKGTYIWHRYSSLAENSFISCRQ